MKTKRFFYYFFTVLFAILLSACGGDDEVLTGDSSGNSGRDVTDLENITSLVVSVRYTTMPAGLKQQLQATAVYGSQGNITRDVTKSVSWSSNSDGLIVSETGEAEAITAGSYLVSANLGSLSDNVDINVVNAQVHNISVNPGDTTIPVGVEFPFQSFANYTINGVDRSYEVTSQVSWSVSNEDDFEISEEGLLVAYQPDVTDVAAVFSYRDHDYTDIATAEAVALQSVTSITVSPDNMQLAKGQSSNLSAEINYTDGSGQSHSVDGTGLVSWVSSEEAIAEVDEFGQVQGIDVGSSQITATFGGKSDIADVSVSNKILQSISVSPQTIKMPAGLTETLTASGHYSDGSSSELSEVSWASEDDSVAMIDGDSGVVTGMGQGTAMITATDAASQLSASSSVIVTTSSLEIQSMVVTPASTDAPLGTKVAYTAVATLTDSSSHDVTSLVSWSTSDSSIATISSGGADAGVFTTKKIGGPITVTASLNGSVGQASASVIDATLTGVIIQPALSKKAIGDTQQYTATGFFSDGLTRDVTSNTTWSSSDSSIVDIDAASGLAEAKAEGNTVITAQTTVNSSSQSSSPAKIEVQGDLVSMVGLQVKQLPGVGAVPAGTQVQFEAVAELSDGTVHDVSSLVQWTSSAPSVAEIATEGHGFVNTLTSGSTSISALFNGNTASATLTVSSAVLSNITLDPMSQMLPVGGQNTYTATGHYSDGSKAELSSGLTWNSSASQVASITDGTVTASSSGNARITVQDSTSGITSVPAIIYVSSATIEDITISPSTATLPIGATQQFTAEIALSNGKTIDGSSLVEWISSAPAYLAIDDKGQATALDSQSGISVTARLQGVMSSNIASVDVVAAALTRIVVSPVSTVIAESLTQQYTATGYYTDGRAPVDMTSSVEWSSSTTSVAKIGTNTGLADAISAGETLITAADPVSGLGGQARLTVTQASVVPTTLTLSPDPLTVGVNQVRRFTATLELSNGTELDVTDGISLSFTDGQYAQDLGNGYVRGVSAGSDTVTGYLGAMPSSSAIINVSSSAPTLDRIELSPDGQTITAGEVSSFGYVVNAFYTDDPTLPVDVTNDSGTTVTVDGTYIVAFDKTTGLATAGSTPSSSGSTGWIAATYTGEDDDVTAHVTTATDVKGCWANGKRTITIDNGMEFLCPFTVKEAEVVLGITPHPDGYPNTYAQAELEAPDEAEGTLVLMNTFIGDFCSSLDYLGHDDWELPSAIDMQTLSSKIGGAQGVLDAGWPVTCKGDSESGSNSTGICPRDIPGQEYSYAQYWLTDTDVNGEHKVYNVSINSSMHGVDLNEADNARNMFTMCVRQR